MKKLIFVTGGVCSSLGKGVAASSIGALLEARGLNIRMIKIDPYINVDAGTMSPYQHGEVYVTDDGAETDLDLGNYARFTRSPLSRANSITTGQIYRAVIDKEREGRYLGKTVQVIPHITDEIQQRILSVMDDKEVDVTIVEIGGTVGDIESIPFLEAARQLINKLGRKDCLTIHLTLVPQLPGGELKTKPTQHSVKELQETGIQPDVLILRSPSVVDKDLRAKIASFTNVDESAVISGHDVATTIYEVPLLYDEQNLDRIILKKLGVESRHSDLKSWKTMVASAKSVSEYVTIAVVGKYMDLNDTYKSIYEALRHGGFANGVGLTIKNIDSALLEEKASGDVLAQADAILVPGGFGKRAIDGMVAAARYARQNRLPYFGICLGLQIMVIEYARSVLGWSDANSYEFSPESAHLVIAPLESQRNLTHYGGTMRLGANPSILKAGSLIHAAYGREKIEERHRHRYELSDLYRGDLEAAGLIISGTTDDGELVEAVEWPNHPWSIGVQFHPEFKSRPVGAHPLFSSFVAAARQRKNGRLEA